MSNIMMFAENAIDITHSTDYDRDFLIKELTEKVRSRFTFFSECDKWFNNNQAILEGRLGYVGLTTQDNRTVVWVAPKTHRVEQYTPILMSKWATQLASVVRNAFTE